MQQQQQPWRRGPTRGELMRARRILVAALILAWATHLLVTQWVNANPPAAVAPASQTTGVLVQMRERAVVQGRQIALADVCRLAWTGAEPPASDGGPIGESLLLEAPTGRTELEVGIDQVLRVLGEAGINAADIRLEGAVRCVVTLSAGPKSDQAGLMEWAGLAGDIPATRPTTRSATPPTAAATPAEPVEPSEVDFIGPPGSLGEMLKVDLASRLQLPEGSVQLTLSPADAQFALRTDVAANHVRPVTVDDLGPVAWAITIDGRETEIHARATAMVTRAVAAGPLGTGQVIREQDVSEQRARIARLEERGMAMSAAIGQQTVGPWKEGEVLTPRRLVPWMLVREGEFMTVHLVRNGIEISVLAKALENGAYGQVIRATSEAIGREMQVRLTAPKVGRMVDSPANPVGR